MTELTLSQRLREHADLHDGLLPYDDAEQIAWAKDLRLAADELEANQKSLNAAKALLTAEIERLRKGHERYETARRMNPRLWSEVWGINTVTGKPFDEIIDDLRPFMQKGGE